MGKKKFNVAIMHGHSKAYQEVEKWVKEFGFTPRVLINNIKPVMIFEKLRQEVWDRIHFVIVIMSADDKGEIQAKNNKVGKKIIRARQNVVFELGYCFGAFDSLDENGEYTAEDAIILLKEEGVESFADIDGLTYVPYNNRTLKSKKEILKSALEDSFSKAKRKYPELK